MKSPYKKITVVGGGVMGTIFVRALVKIGSSANILVCEKNISYHKNLKKIGPQVHTTNDLSECESADVIFLAIKPQDFPNINLQLNKKTLVCSIMAGISISEISTQFKIKKVVRMMPNMAARVDEGFTAWTATSNVSAQEKVWVKNFLSQMGAEFYVKEEQQINKVTAITGSGPAYILHTLSIFKDAAKKLGFKEKEAHLMVRQVLRGVNALVDETTDFDEMILQVASKGGTTEAALKVFASSNIKKIWAKAVEASHQRARELSQQK